MLHLSDMTAKIKNVNVPFQFFFILLRIKHQNLVINMKKTLLFAVALLTASFAHAQFSTSIGYVFSPIHDYDETYNAHGVNVELDYDYNIAGNLFLSAGLGMDLSFYKISDNDSTFNGRLFDLSVPVDLSYRFNLGSDVKLNIFAGPTFMLGISHAFIYSGEKLSDYYNAEHYPIKRFGLELGGGASLDIKNQYRIKVSYKKGLLDMDKSGEYPFKKDYLIVSVGYIF